MEFLNLLACPACGFDANSETTAAANLAIGFMILVLASVLGGIAGFIWRMARLERRALDVRNALAPAKDGAGIFNESLL